MLIMEYIELFLIAVVIAGLIDIISRLGKVIELLDEINSKIQEQDEPSEYDEFI